MRWASTAQPTPSAPHRVIPIHTAVSSTPAEHEVSRVMQICKACRYCEGFCAVFPAMTRRLEFGKADAQYLANLCHNFFGTASISRCLVAVECRSNRDHRE